VEGNAAVHHLWVLALIALPAWRVLAGARQAETAVA
jgi:hypothetical protein